MLRICAETHEIALFTLTRAGSALGQVIILLGYLFSMLLDAYPTYGVILKARLS